MSELTVRRALSKDIDGIMKLLEQVNLLHHQGRPDLFKRATKYSRRELEHIIEDNATPVFVCVPSDEAEAEEAEEVGKPEHRVLGHAFCIRQKIGNAVLEEIDTLYIDDICVDEDARGRGVGRMLFDHVEEYAKDGNFYNITLNVWALNPGAKAFYDSCGMEVQKYGMEKVLK